MALTDIFKSIGNGLSEEIQDFKSIIRRIRLTADTSALGANYRRYGPSFGVYDFGDYVKKAREFYQAGVKSEDPYYTVVELPGNRVAIDYNCELRGIFTSKGKPLAFFRHDFRNSGYESRAAELEDFKRGKHVLFS
jgi:pyocin large subunit-like protein